MLLKSVWFFAVSMRFSMVWDVFWRFGEHYFWLLLFAPYSGWSDTFITVKWQLNTCSRLFNSFPNGHNVCDFITLKRVFATYITLLSCTYLLCSANSHQFYTKFWMKRFSPFYLILSLSLALALALLFWIFGYVHSLQHPNWNHSINIGVYTLYIAHTRHTLVRLFILMH